MEPPILPDGPTGHHNWRASIEGNQPRGAQEFGLYSDAHIPGELREGIGPYKVFNLGARPGPRADCCMCAVLRWDNFLGPIAMSSEATDTTRYHGGDQTDEIASLIGLILGGPAALGRAHSRVRGG